MMGFLDRSFNVRPKPCRPDISTKRVPPRSMTADEKKYYDKHRNLAGFYK